MRQNRRIFLVTVALIINLILGLKANSQEISKVSEIYDYEIGDIFHFYHVGTYNWSIGMIEHINTSIVDKYYSFNNDTLFYIQEVTGDYTEYPPDTTIYYSYSDTIKYFNLDSAINYGGIDTVYIDPNLYNGRKINYKLQSYWDRYFEYKYVDGCGRAYYFYQFSDPPFPGLEEKNELIYFLKGEEEWGEPFYVRIPEIQNESTSITIYPNPGKDYINIKSIPSIENEVEIQFNSIDSRLAETYFKKLNQNSQIDISNLANGIYLISLKTKHEIFHTRFIKY